ncbi:hypothetical protein D9611_013606 [Ephemerocybe angulata]|uniref:HMG box domain-containing protein n=1 Tax=Ephemerocybe angulata TaxID=980116 RepID=A0A8H5ERJ3_9AGAR|nr:hypothetical protein D9611_013606 [Tulosesus angulatus]
MDRYPSYSRQPYAAAASTRASQRGSRASSYREPEIHDDRGSVSGSEDGNYALFQDPVKHDGDHEPDGHDLALTSQTLNADGTPKRPMNAFMIFARRRRPQVSAENQAMRTGEISKLLSKEWSAMPSSEKQFYQDQAKMLKDTFNTKYPDYVYRRRPNNSRRRRRSDALRPDGGEVGDDGAPIGDFESPTDGDEHVDGASDSSYSRGSHEPPTFGEPLKYPAGPPISRSSTHPFQSNHPLYRNGDSRLPYPIPSSDRLSHGLSHRLSNPSLNYSLSSSSSSSYPPDVGTSQSWHSRLDRGPTGWSSERSPPSLKTGNWGGSSGGGWNSGLSTSASSSSNYHSSSNFPTLNTPFYPSQSSMTEYSGGESSGSASSQYDGVPLQPVERSHYDSRGTSLLEPLTYPAGRNMSRVLPPISGYTSSHLSSTSPSMSSQYWSRS